MFFDSELITWFVDSFTLGMKFYSVVYLLSGSAYPYWILDLNLKILNMGFVDKWPSRMQGQCLLRSRAGRATIFSRIQKTLNLFWGLPMSLSTSP